MCGRFTVTTKDTKSIADRFQVELEKALQAKDSTKDNGSDGASAKEKSPPGLGRFNVAPTQEILVVRDSPDEERAAAGEREARLMRWGLVPVWAKDLKSEAAAPAVALHRRRRRAVRLRRPLHPQGVARPR